MDKHKMQNNPSEEECEKIRKRNPDIFVQEDKDADNSKV